MCSFRKAFVLFVILILSLALTMPALAQSRIVSNMVVVMPSRPESADPPEETQPEVTPAPEAEETEEPEETEDPETEIGPGETVNPEETEEPGEVAPEETEEPEESVDPEATEEPAETDIPEETVIPDEGDILPGGASVSIAASIRQRDDVPTYGDHVRLDSTLDGLDGYEVSLQWQQRKNGEWFDLAGATDASFTFIMTEENANDAWRLFVIAYAK